MTTREEHEKYGLKQALEKVLELAEENALSQSSFTFNDLDDVTTHLISEQQQAFKLVQEHIDSLDRAPVEVPTTTMTAFIALIARMTYDGEELADGTEFIMENDDAVITLSDLIIEARKLQAL